MALGIKDAGQNKQPEYGHPWAAGNQRVRSRTTAGKKPTTAGCWQESGVAHLKGHFTVDQRHGGSADAPADQDSGDPFPGPDFVHAPVTGDLKQGVADPESNQHQGQ